MRRLILFVLVIVAAAGAGYLVAHRSAGPSDDGTAAIGRAHSNSHREAQEDSRHNETASQSDAATSDPVAGALTALFEKADKEEMAIPKGVKLLSVKVDKGIATVDLSPQFNELKEHGSTMESHAQRSLRQTLASFANVQKMLILVEGKHFEGEHGDWSEPIPVRDENAGTSE